jgi:hypothetical protein
MKEADLLGRAEISVAEIMGARNWTVTKQLTAQKSNHNYGSIIIRGFRVAVLMQSYFTSLALPSCFDADSRPAPIWQDDAREDDLLSFALDGITLAAKDKKM